VNAFGYSGDSGPPQDHGPNAETWLILYEQAKPTIRNYLFVGLKV